MNARPRPRPHAPYTVHTLSIEDTQGMAKK